VVYDYDRIKKSLTRTAIQSRPHTMCVTGELLPWRTTDGRLQVGFTPLVKADRLAKKSASANCGSRTTRSTTHPVVQGPRRERGVEPGAGTGFDTVACASTGNLAIPSPPTRGRRFKSYVFIPSDLEQARSSIRLSMARMSSASRAITTR